MHIPLPRRRVFLIPLVAALALIAAALSPTPGGVARAAGITPNAWQLSWADDFNGPAGSAPDGSKWGYDIGGGGWGNSEREYYTNSRANSALDGNGNLVITARKDDASGYQCWYGTCQYTSARLLTSGKFTQAYGRFEARIKIPRGQGMWPAFWMLGDNINSVGWPNSGEIDVMENIGREPAVVHGSMHGPGYSGAAGPTASYTLSSGAFADAFHVFAVDWTPTSITWSVDGNVYETRTPSDIGGNTWVFNHPFFILLNVAVGGSWPGDPDGSTQFPQQMVVDYVHVFTAGSGSTGGGQITGYGGKCVDVQGANTANGTPVQIYDCNGTAAQQWSRPGDGTIRALGKCLDVNGAGTADGTKVQLYDCNGTGAQQWVVNSSGTIVNPHSTKCLDDPASSTTNGTQLEIWTCNGGANQKWTVS